MNNLFFFLVLVMLAGLSEAVNPAQVVMNTVNKELIAVVNPVGELLLNVGFNQCEALKKVLGISYKQIEGKHDPDVNKLEVVYKSNNYTKVYNITDAAESLQKERTFDPHEKFVFFVHGFIDDPSKKNFKQIAEGFLKSGEGDRVNLLALDCSSLIHWLYARSTTYVVFIGQRLADLIVALTKMGIQHSQIHLVGHSLGAQICGFAGKEILAQTGKKVGRISGLDPAGPCFANVGTNFRLNAADAEYVDVIHGDGGVFGIRSPVGHADYFPNKGEAQPGCLFTTCSHSRVVELYAESLLKGDAFPAVHCHSWRGFTKGECTDEISYMGYRSKPGTRGQFYLQTASNSPYGLGMKGTKFRNNLGLLRNVLGSVGGLLAGKK